MSRADIVGAPHRRRLVIEVHLTLSDGAGSKAEGARKQPAPAYMWLELEAYFRNAHKGNLRSSKKRIQNLDSISVEPYTDPRDTGKRGLFVLTFESLGIRARKGSLTSAENEEDDAVLGVEAACDFTLKGESVMCVTAKRAKKTTVVPLTGQGKGAKTSTPRPRLPPGLEFPQSFDLSEDALEKLAHVLDVMISVRKSHNLRDAGTVTIAPQHIVYAAWILVSCDVEAVRDVVRQTTRAVEKLGGRKTTAKAADLLEEARSALVDKLDPKYNYKVGNRAAAALVGLSMLQQPLADGGLCAEHGLDDGLVNLLTRARILAGDVPRVIRAIHIEAARATYGDDVRMTVVEVDRDQAETILDGIRSDTLLSDDALASLQDAGVPSAAAHGGRPPAGPAAPGSHAVPPEDLSVVLPEPVAEPPGSGAPWSMPKPKTEADSDSDSDSGSGAKPEIGPGPPPPSSSAVPPPPPSPSSSVVPPPVPPTPTPELLPSAPPASAFGPAAPLDVPVVPEDDDDTPLDLSDPASAGGAHRRVARRSRYL